MGGDFIFLAPLAKEVMRNTCSLSAHELVLGKDWLTQPVLK